MGGPPFGFGGFPVSFSGFDQGTYRELSAPLKGEEPCLPLTAALLQVLAPFQRWAEESPPSPRPSAGEEGEQGGRATSDPCPPPPSSSTAEKSPQNGICTSDAPPSRRRPVRRLALTRFPPLLQDRGERAGAGGGGGGRPVKVPHS